MPNVAARRMLVKLLKVLEIISLWIDKNRFKKALY